MSEFRVTKLPTLTKASFPERLLFLDTETKIKRIGEIEKHSLKLSWLCHYRKRNDVKQATEIWTQYKNAYALCKSIEAHIAEKTTVYLFAHNAFFDLQVIQFYHWFNKWGWKLDFNYEKGLVYLLSVSKGTRHLKCISTTNYFYDSIDKLGQYLGKPKLKVDFETVTDDELSLYCKRDTEILKEAVLHYINYIKKHKLGGFCLTRASQAFTAFRYSYLKSKLYINRIDYISELERSGYYGGRTEVFEFGKISGSKFITLDINSQYPFVMRNKSVPVRLLDYKVRPKIAEVEQRLEKHLAIAEVRVNTDKPIYAKVIKGKVCFPVGKFTTTVCTEGLKRGLENGYIKEILQISYYRGRVLFKDYVDDLYNWRQEYKLAGNKMMEQFCKYMLNSLYGKFGQKISITEMLDCDETDYTREEFYDATTGKRWIEYQLFGKIIKETGEFKEGKHSIVSIPAHITEYARFLLYDYIEAAGLNKVLYCDTDSIKIREEDIDGLRPFMHETELGKLKIEDECNELTINGAKYYITEKFTKLKGVPKRAIQIQPGIYKYLHFNKQKTHMKKGIDKCFIAKPIIKIVKPKYDKGIILPNGRVKPFRLSEF